MIVGSRDSAVNARAAIAALRPWSLQESGGIRLSPLLLTDGSYALPAEIASNARFAAALPFIAGWATATPAPSDYVPQISGQLTAQLELLVNGKTMRHVGRPAGLTMPASNVFRFETHVNDFAGTFDSNNANRRCEIVSDDPATRGVGAGTLWSSFCVILGNTPGLTKTRSGPLGAVHQWHSVDTSIGRSPPFHIDCSNNVMQIITRSSASVDGNSNGLAVQQYLGTIPAKGVRAFFVVQGTTGASGHLNVWMNGTQIVNVDTPIGYYTDLTDGSGRTELAYPHWGLYTRNQGETDVVCIANPEWGTASLSARVDTPLSVPEFAIDTDNDMFPYTLPFTLRT